MNLRMVGFRFRWPFCRIRALPMVALMALCVACAHDSRIGVDGEEFPPEMVDFVPYEGNPVFAGTGTDTWDRVIRERGFILREGNTYHMWYTGYADRTIGLKRYLGYATSPDGLKWTRFPGNPIFSKGWVEDMCVIKHDGTYYMYAEDETLDENNCNARGTQCRAF